MSDMIIKEDGICPVTKIHCDDECCPVGATCNLSNSSLSGEVNLRSIIDKWCIDQFGNTHESLERADAMFVAAREVFYKPVKQQSIEEEFKWLSKERDAELCKPIDWNKSQTIEEAAEKSSELQEATYTIQHKITYKHGFIDGVKSEAAKEYWYKQFKQEKHV